MSADKPQRCEFVGSLGDQVFRCRHCDAFPEDCIDGDCCCDREQPPQSLTTSTRH